MKKFAIFLLLFSMSCVAPRVSITNNNANSSNPIVDGKLFSTAWQQRSAEYRALCYQAFNIANHCCPTKICNNIAVPFSG